MTDAAYSTTTERFQKRLRQRYAAERRFRLLGFAAVASSVLILAFLLVSMTMNGIGGFQRAELRVPVNFAQSGLTIER